ncbi:MAG TPA: hypothetical protein VGR63_08110 [Casimicrobiaceae bacterium]|nr:hypothetical protein [Casimicrobiaceae bacterium]
MGLHPIVPLEQIHQHGGMCHFLRSSRINHAAVQPESGPLRPIDRLQRWSAYLDRMPDEFVDALSGRDDPANEPDAGTPRPAREVTAAIHKTS